VNAPNSRLFCVDLASPEDSVALTRAFIWLKRRIEEGASRGYLALPNLGFLDSRLRDALGWRLTNLLREEGALALGQGRQMVVVTYETLQGSREPVTAVEPGVRDLARLASRSGLVLVATSSRACGEAWKATTRAGEPPEENYLIGLPTVARTDQAGAAGDVDVT
jgi:hypothetical protein